MSKVEQSLTDGQKDFYEKIEKKISEGINIDDKICSKVIQSYDIDGEDIFSKHFEESEEEKCDLCLEENQKVITIEKVLEIIKNYFDSKYQAAEISLDKDGDINYRGQGEEGEEILEYLLHCDEGLKKFIKDKVDIDTISTTYELISDAEVINKEIEGYYKFIEGLDKFSKIKEEFKENINLVEKFIENLKEDDFCDMQLRMIFSQIITIMEKYFCDSFSYCMFNKKVVGNEELLEKYLKEYNKKTKINYQDIFKEYKKIEKTIKEDLYKKSFHNINNIMDMINIIKINNDNIEEFNTNLNKIRDDVLKRHDFVHRLKYDKDGKLVEITKEEVENLIEKVEELVNTSNTIMSNYEEYQNTIVI